MIKIELNSKYDEIKIALTSKSKYNHVDLFSVEDSYYELFKSLISLEAGIKTGKYPEDEFEYNEVKSIEESFLSRVDGLDKTQRGSIFDSNMHDIEVDSIIQLIYYRKSIFEKNYYLAFQLLRLWGKGFFNFFYALDMEFLPYDNFILPDKDWRSLSIFSDFRSFMIDLSNCNENKSIDSISIWWFGIPKSGSDNIIFRTFNCGIIGYHSEDPDISDNTKNSRTIITMTKDYTLSLQSFDFLEGEVQIYKLVSTGDININDKNIYTNPLIGLEKFKISDRSILTLDSESNFKEEENKNIEYFSKDDGNYNRKFDHFENYFLIEGDYQDFEAIMKTTIPSMNFNSFFQMVIIPFQIRLDNIVWIDSTISFDLNLSSLINFNNIFYLSLNIISKEMKILDSKTIENKDLAIEKNKLKHIQTFKIENIQDMKSCKVAIIQENKILWKDELTPLTENLNFTLSSMINFYNNRFDNLCSNTEMEEGLKHLTINHVSDRLYTALKATHEPFNGTNISNNKNIIYQLSGILELILKSIFKQKLVTGKYTLKDLIPKFLKVVDNRLVSNWEDYEKFINNEQAIPEYETGEMILDGTLKYEDASLKQYDIALEHISRPLIFTHFIRNQEIHTNIVRKLHIDKHYFDMTVETIFSSFLITFKWLKLF